MTHGVWKLRFQDNYAMYEHFKDFQLKMNTNKHWSHEFDIKRAVWRAILNLPTSPEEHARNEYQIMFEFWTLGVHPGVHLSLRWSVTSLSEMKPWSTGLVLSETIFGLWITQICGFMVTIEDSKREKRPGTFRVPNMGECDKDEILWISTACRDATIAQNFRIPNLELLNLF